MSVKVLNAVTKLFERSFMRVLRRTVVMLFPFALIGAFASVIANSVFAPFGFANSIFSIYQWFPFATKIRTICQSVSQLTLGIASLLAAYQAARYTTKGYHKDSQMAGLTSFVGYLLICYRPTGQRGISFNWTLLGMQGLLLGLLFGYFVGQIFRRVGGSDTTIAGKTRDIFDRAFIALPAILVVSVIGILGEYLVVLLNRYSVISEIVTRVVNFGSQQHEVVSTILVGMLTTLMGWLGMSGPYATFSFSDDPSAIANLNRALTKHSLWQIPYKYTGTTLFHSFGSFGGLGSTLALLIAILIVAKHQHVLRVARWSLLPVLFNNNALMLLGIPLLLNPLYLVPFMLTPVFNMVIAAFAIYLRLMPPVAYPVPLGTPGVLVAFIGTGGHFSALIVGLICLLIDVLIYLPFVQLSEDVVATIERKEDAENEIS